MQKIYDNLDVNDETADFIGKRASLPYNETAGLKDISKTVRTIEMTPLENVQNVRIDENDEFDNGSQERESIRTGEKRQKSSERKSGAQKGKSMDKSNIVDSTISLNDIKGNGVQVVSHLRGTSNPQ